jgi:hypothetical protein
MEDFELRSHVLYSQTLIDALKIEFYPKQCDLRNFLTLKKLLFLSKLHRVMNQNFTRTPLRNSR